MDKFGNVKFFYYICSRHMRKVKSNIVFKSYTSITESLPNDGDFVMIQVDFDNGKQTSFAMCKFENKQFLYGKKPFTDGEIVAWKKV